jgi:putative ABC transport system permease protein
VFRLAAKSVRHNPKRLILTAFAVALGVSLVASSFTFTNALSNGFSDLFSEIYAGQDVVVEPAPDAQTSDDPFAATEALFSDADVEAIAAVAGVSAAAGGTQVMATVLPAQTEEGSPPPGFGPPTQLFNWTGIEQFDRSVIVDGSAPQNVGEMVLDIDSVENLGYSLGDAVIVAADQGLEEFTLVGAVRFGEENDLQGATLGYFTNADALRLSGSENFQQVSVSVEEGQDPDEVASRIEAVLPEGARALSGEQKAAEETAEIGEFLEYINIISLVFALISLFVGAYLIVNTFRVIVQQRTRELGLLRAIGASGKQIRAMILGEAFVVGIAASAAGLVGGYLLALVLAWGIGFVVPDVFGAITLPLDAVIWGLGLGLLVTLVSALLPAIHASRISPMEALRDSATSGKKPLKVRNVVGGAMTLLGALTVGVGFFASVAQPAIWVGAGAVLIVLGVTLLAAQVLVPLAFGLRGLLTAWFGVDGKLAANNIHREPRRSANTAAALMIGVMLLALVATFTESFKSTATAQFEQMTAQLVVASAAGDGVIQPGALDVIADVDGVNVVTTLGFGTVKMDEAGYSLAVIEPDTAELAFDYNNDPSFAELDGGVFIDPVLQDLGIEVGDQVTLVGAEGTVTLDVTGLYLNEGDANLWVDPQTGSELLGEVPIVQALVVLDEDADAGEVEAAINEELASTYPTTLVLAPSALQTFINLIVTLVITITSALLGAAIVIALLGVANTLLLSVTERTREIGLLRAVGLKRRSVWRMITVESMVMAIFGTILGMILGVALGAALVLSLEDFGFVGVTIPWPWLVLYTVLAAIAGVVAAIWPAWRASRLDILKAIAADG